MWRALVPTLLAAAMLVAVVASPAAADKPETWTVIHDEISVGPVTNPCTNHEAMLSVAFAWKLHVLPSIESFWSGDFKHANWTVTGQIVGDDGYETQWRNRVAGVINQRRDHYVETESENLMFYGDDGGKYRVRIAVQIVEVGGEAKVFRTLDEGVCVRQPAG